MLEAKLSISRLNNWVSCWRCLHRSSASFCLIVGSVVGTWLHLNTQLVLVKLGW